MSTEEPCHTKQGSYGHGKPGKVMEFVKMVILQAWKNPGERKEIPKMLENSWKFVIFICSFKLSF